MRNSLPIACAHCKSEELYTRNVPAYGHMPLLHGLGGFLRFPTIDVVLCASCGHMMLFADEAACKKVAGGNTKWKRVGEQSG